MNYLQTFHEPLRLMAIEIFGEDRVATVPGHVWVRMSGNTNICKTFNPFVNSDDMEAVEAWLLKEHILYCTPINDGVWGEQYISVQKAPSGKYPKTYSPFKHDGTRDSIRRAKAMCAVHVVTKKYKLDKGDDE